MVFKIKIRANDHHILETYNGSIFHKEKEQVLEISTKSKDLKKLDEYLAKPMTLKKLTIEILYDEPGTLHSDEKHGKSVVF